MAAIAWLLVAIGAGLVGLGGVALFKLKAAGTTEVQLLGMKVTTLVEVHEAGLDAGPADLLKDLVTDP